MIFFLTLSVLSGCSSAKVKFADLPSEGPVVILGDSMAAGYGLEEKQSFVAELSRRLEVPIVNLGRSGATTEESLKRVSQEVLPLDPSLVIIELGGNDALQKIDPVRTEKNLATMIEEVQKESIPVLLLGIRGGLTKDKYSGMYRDLSAKYQTGYVPDIMDGIWTNASLKLDSVHPNAAGHQRVADHVEPELRRILETLRPKS